MDGWRDPEVRLADGKACLAAALRYVARGWSVLPLCPPDHAGVGAEHSRRCDSPGKAPLVPWKAYQSRRPTTDEVCDWWDTWPTANVGVVMGPVSGLVGIDVDGEGGERRLAEFSGGDLPETLEFSTPNGRRLLYAPGGGLFYPPGLDLSGAAGEVRLLGQGSQTVMPPSRHKSGEVYRWVREH
jgi:hypothetical protein